MTHRGRLSLLLLFIFLAACQPASPTVNPVPQSTGTAHPAVLTPPPSTSIGIPEEALRGVAIQAWMPWFGVEANLFVSQVNDFNSTNPWGIQVQAVSQSNYTELYNNVTAVLRTDDRPQLVIALPEHAIEWDASGQVVDLSPYVDDPRYGLSGDEVHDFPSVFWSQDAVGARRLGVPAQRTARFMLYNSSWGRELGFEDPPQNTSEFQQQACRAHQTMLADSVRNNDGMGGWLVDSDALTFLSWMSAFGGGVLEGNNYRFLTPKNLAAIAYVKQLYDQGCAWTDQAGSGGPDVFASRKALFTTASLEQLPDYARAIATSGKGDEWTVIPFPGAAGPRSGLMIYGSSYVVLKSTPEQQLASWLFVRWLVSPENQKKWVEVNGMFPLRSSSLELLADYQKTHPQWARAVSLLPHAQMEPQLASWRKVRVMIGDGFEAMFQSNTPAGRVAEILAIMESTARDLTKQSP